MQRVVFVALIAALIGGGFAWYKSRQNYSDDRAIWMALVKTKDYAFAAFKVMPEKLIDREMCLAAVKSEGYAIKYVPEKFKDCEMCQEAVKREGVALEYIPENFCDREMCLTAIKQRGDTLQYVPEKFRDREMRLTASLR